MLVERLAGRMLVDPLGVLLARPARLRQRVGPRALELQDLRAMHETRRGEVIICRWSWHQRPSAAVHSRARPSSWTRWQQLITLQ